MNTRALDKKVCVSGKSLYAEKHTHHPVGAHPSRSSPSPKDPPESFIALPSTGTVTARLGWNWSNPASDDAGSTVDAGPTAEVPASVNANLLWQDFTGFYAAVARREAQSG
jgi:hypothetical protein